ncbi:serine hydrolase domain-containing protein [Caulobacter sp. UC70_42]|uniref:serine hydrolase domain-containing protein n=1 Tax=Caulobacter sp. UC70_42 TaxID=3374551 RepID=UPI003757F862
MMKGRDSALFLPTRRGVLGAIPAAAMVSSAVAAAPPRTTALSPEATKAIGGMVDGFVAQNRADGLSVAVVMNGAMRFFNAGVTSQTTLTAATEHHVYEIGSVSKTFTALILASAIKEGRVALNDPVRKFLPPGFDNLAKDGRAVTFADIVTTTSALPDNVPDYLAVAPGARPNS